MKKMMVTADFCMEWRLIVNCVVEIHRKMCIENVGFSSKLTLL